MGSGGLHLKGSAATRASASCMPAMPATSALKQVRLAAFPVPCCGCSRHTAGHMQATGNLSVATPHWRRRERCGVMASRANEGYSSPGDAQVRAHTCVMRRRHRGGSGGPSSSAGAPSGRQNPAAGLRRGGRSGAAPTWQGCARPGRAPPSRRRCPGTAGYKLIWKCTASCTAHVPG